MKQVIQSYRTGALAVVDAPPPALQPGGVLVRNVCSAVSVGTEKQMMDMARKSLLGKARARPELVRQLLNKARTDGILEAYRAAMGRLDVPVALGYSCAGEVVGVGYSTTGLRVGQRVACFGQGYASHAEIVFVPQDLCIEVPAGVKLEEAAFAGLGAISLHAVRMCAPRPGYLVAVIGLGLLGQLAVQILNALGCQVFGIDIDPAKAELALQQGAAASTSSQDRAEVASRVREHSGGRGADAALVFASTPSNEPIELAAELAAEGASISVPGLVGLNLPRHLFFEKELRLVVPKGAGLDRTAPVSAGGSAVEPGGTPGGGTIRRNMAEFLELLGERKLQVAPLITHRFPVGEAGQAYRMIQKGTAPYVGVVLTYPGPPNTEAASSVGLMQERRRAPSSRPGEMGLGLIGAGLFARTTLLPTLRGIKGIRLEGVATATGVSGRHVGRKYGFRYCTSDYRELLADGAVRCVVIATRHNLHAALAREALRAGKHVFVEKPLAVTAEELPELLRAYKESNRELMVGFNRRFASLTLAAKEFLDQDVGPLLMQCRVNAGSVLAGSWVLDPVEGGGRIVGEVCHFVDLLQCLAGAPVATAYAQATRAGQGWQRLEDRQDVAVTLGFHNGSVANLLYTSLGDRALPRERIEVFRGSSVCVIDNFKSLLLARRGRLRKVARWNLDRGYRGELEAFFAAVREGSHVPVSMSDYLLTTLATFCILESLQQGRPVAVDPRRFNLEL